MRRLIPKIAAALLALFIPLSIALANPSIIRNPGDYVIQPGDTLWQVAMTNDITLQALLDANPELNPYALPIGAVVHIPNNRDLLAKDPLDREPTRNEYAIQAGDDLWGVSLRFDVSLDDLLAANPEIDPYALSVGDLIVVPGVVVNPAATEVPMPSSTADYVVQAGDDLWSIASAHNVSFVTLAALNEGVDPYALQVGQVLALPGSSTSAADGADESAVPADDAPANPIQVVPLAEMDSEPASANEIAISLSDFVPNTGAPTNDILPLDETVGHIDLQPIEEAPVDDASALTAPSADEIVEDVPADPIVSVEDLTSSVVPINISVPDSFVVQDSMLTLNGVELGRFAQTPIQYELDMAALAAGAYNLTFTASTTSDVTSTGTMQFEIIYAGENAPNPDDPKLNSAGADQPNVIAPRQLLLNGVEQTHLDLSFSPEGGLAQVVTAAPAAAVTEPTDLVSILTSPTSLIPEPVRELLLTPHPTEAAIIILIMTITLAPQGIFTLYHMMYTWNNPAAAEKYRSPQTFTEPQHSFTAILPARLEEDVIRQTIMAVDRINYPDHLKEVLVMVRDEDDDATIEAVRQTIADLGKDNIHLITFTDGPRNKPNGLNKGLRAATKEVICVFDAEDEPHEDIYNVINTVMIRDNADVVQSGVQLMNFRSTWFSALNCLEYFFWFKSGLHCFTHAFRVTPLGGNTVFFKKFWLDRIGGWDTKCLTEDADVGIRLTQAGAKIQIVYDERHATQEETPATVDSFIKQRTRWCQGFYQVFFKGDWLKLPEMRQRITAIYILLNSLMQAATLLYLPIGVFIALTQQIAVPIALLSYIPIFILLLQLITNLIGIREFTEAYDMKLPFLFRFKMVLAYYPYQLMMAVASFRAVFRFLGQQQAWEKTSHANLHRQSIVAR